MMMTMEGRVYPKSRVHTKGRVSFASATTTDEVIDVDATSEPNTDGDNISFLNNGTGSDGLSASCAMDGRLCRSFGIESNDSKATEHRKVRRLGLLSSLCHWTKEACGRHLHQNPGSSFLADGRWQK